MQVPLRVDFRNLKRSSWIEQIIQEKVDKLEHFCKRIVSCHVVVEMPHKHQHQGNLYLVRINIVVQGKTIAINREATEHAASQDISAALHGAFAAARRQLEDYMRRLRSDVKTHHYQEHAKVVNLHPDQGYGFLETSEGKEVYFNANSIINENFDDLMNGAEVAFAEAAGDEGPQASSVRVVKHKRKKKD